MNPNFQLHDVPWLFSSYIGISLFFSCSLFIVISFWNNSSLSKDVTFVTTLQYTSSSCKYYVQIKEGMFVP